MGLMLTGAWTLLMFACTAGTGESGDGIFIVNLFILFAYSVTFYLLGAYFGV